jgi:hypothetical protein
MMFTKERRRLSGPHNNKGKRRRTSTPKSITVDFAFNRGGAIIMMYMFPKNGLGNHLSHAFRFREELTSHNAVQAQNKLGLSIPRVDNTKSETNPRVVGRFESHGSSFQNLSFIFLSSNGDGGKLSP